MKIVLLISGNLGFTILKKLFESENELVAIFTNKNSIDIVNFCNHSNIKCFQGNPRNNAAQVFIKKVNCEVLLSVNYLYLIDQDLIDLPSKYAINIHGSLLPKYRGRTPHVWAIINGESRTGITAHIITKNMDEGDIVEQKKVPINVQDTGAAILDKFKTLYYPLITSILSKISNETIILTKQNNELATYYHKRTPADGLINWNWQINRIRNWVRALAKPYPGAFAKYKGVKVIFNSCKPSAIGYDSMVKNGTILRLNEKSIVVKTPNGALELLEIDSTKNVTFEVGESFL